MNETPPIHEIYFQEKGSIHELATKIRQTLNIQESNYNNTSQQQENDEWGVHYIFEVLGLKLVLIENSGAYHISSYASHQYILFLKWNIADRQVIRELYDPLFTVLGNLFYRSGYEIEVDCLLLEKRLQGQKDPLLDIEEDKKQLGL